MFDTLSQSALIIPGAVILVTITLWATRVLPEYLVALIFFASAMILRIAPSDTIFAGFQSDAFWLVLSGFIIGTAIRKVGIADFIARRIDPLVSGSWLKMLAGTVILTYLLAFVMPSNMGRITLLMPIVMAVADRAGFEEGSRGRIALALAVGFGTFQLSASILPANVPNLVMTGAAFSSYGQHFQYVSYLALHAPILGILKGVILTFCLYFLFPATPEILSSTEREDPLSPAAKRLAFLLAATLILWCTDSIHGIPAAWVGLAAACLCLLPRGGFLSGDEFANGLNMRACIYVAGILGLATVVSKSGIGMIIGQELVKIAPISPESPLISFGTLAGFSSLLSFFVTSNGVPALYTPLAETLSHASGFSLPAVIMIQVIGYSTPVLPYQASPIVVAMVMARVPLASGIRLCIALATATFIFLVPLDYFWFRLMGWI
ncbi:SLC13 family permease [Pantoea sp. Lu_F5_004]|uniref:SLC13 family permease n=1 Tax=Pantoea sp. Lu_F5_004 TaxID=3443507 RepID=UPI003EB8F0B6